VDPSPEVDEHEATEQDAWNQNQQQLVSPGFATLAGVSVHAAYQFNHSTGQQRTIVDQNSNSLPRISDARLPLYGPHGNPGPQAISNLFNSHLQMSQVTVEIWRHLLPPSTSPHFSYLRPKLKLQDSPMTGFPTIFIPQ
jgi:hypothetical protein